MKRKAHAMLVAISDLHCGSHRAICPPMVEIGDGRTLRIVNYNPVQRLLHDWWDEFWNETAGIKSKEKRRCVVLVNGETVEGSHHGSEELLTNDVLEQEQIAVELLRRLRSGDVADKLIITKGTRAHSGHNASSDKRVARELGADSLRGHVCSEEAEFSINGMIVHAKHHISASMRPWTEGNNARIAALTMLHARLEDGAPMPRLLIRSHVHRSFDTGKMFPVRCVITPCWKLSDGYSSKITDRKPHIGGIIVRVDTNGNIEDVDIKKYWLPKETPEAL